MDRIVGMRASTSDDVLVYLCTQVTLTQTRLFVKPLFGVAYSAIRWYA